MDFAEVMVSPEMNAFYTAELERRVEFNDPIGYNDPRTYHLINEATTCPVLIYEGWKITDVATRDFRLDPEFEKKYIELRDSLLKIKSNPAKTKRLTEEGNELLKEGKSEEAVKKYTAAMRFALDPGLYCIRAYARHAMKDYHQAILDCRAALGIDPGYVEAHVRMGLAFAGLEIHGEAIAIFKNVAKIVPEEYRDRLKEAGDVERLDEKVDIVGMLLTIEHNPDEAKRLKGEGVELFNEGKHGEAARKFTEAMRFALDPALYCLRSAAFHCMKEYHKSLRDCRTNLALDPSHAEAFSRMGLVFTSMENHRGAVLAYQRAVKMEPGEKSYKDRLKEAKKALKRQGGNASETDEKQQARLLVSQLMMIHPKYREEMMRYSTTGDAEAHSQLLQKFLQNEMQNHPVTAVMAMKILSDK